MALESGTHLGHYEITDQIGKGGMGEVYRARDTKLGREVAIKVLPAEFARDEERLARLEREARMLAALNHPNIAAIYGLEESDDTRFLVLELVEGDTLADRLKLGAIPVEESLKLALQIAEALEAAHEKGVIHRDLKPANIKVTPEGRVKVLDFGLAKAFIGEQADVNLSNSPTLSMAATQAGIILGTAAYMSPEQAKGRTVDKRADIWAFGAVLYEMLTDRQCFGAEDVSEALAAVIRAEPDWSGLPAHLHPRLKEVLQRCLAKDLGKRFRDIGDVKGDIENVLTDPGGVLIQHAASVGQVAPQSKLPWVAALILGVVVAGVAGWNFRPLSLPRPVVRSDYELPEGRSFSSVVGSVVALSPTGSHFAYVGDDGLYLRSLNAFEAAVIPGTEGAQLLNPMFSKDGQWIAYFADDELRKVSLTGGAPLVLSEVPLRTLGASWSAEDTIFFAQPDGIWRVSADGGDAARVIPTEPNELVYGPQLLPGGDWVLFSRMESSGVPSWDDAEIVAQSLESGERRMIWRGGSDARYVPTGHLLYAYGNAIYAAGFDPDRLEVTGVPIPMVEGVQRGRNLAEANYGVSDGGVLIYVPGGAAATEDTVVAIVDRDGVRTPLDLPPNRYGQVRVSPDGRRLALQTVEPNGDAIWVYDLSGNTSIRRLTEEGHSVRPVWTPDSQRVTFASQRDGTWGIYWRLADGSTVPELLWMGEEGDTQIWPNSWSPDAQTLAFTRGSASGRRLWTLSPGDGVGPQLFDDISAANAAFAPNGQWLAYNTSSGGDMGIVNNIYVQPFPATGVRYPITERRASSLVEPVWSPDGRELYFVSTEQPTQLMTVSITAGAELEYGSERRVGIDGVLPAVGRQYDVMPDGQRFVAVFSSREAEGALTRPRINIVLNWFTELRERVPVD